MNDALMGQPATVADGSSGVLDNLCTVPKKKPPICPGSEEGLSPRTNDASESRRSGWIDEAHVKLRVISISVMADAVTIDEPVIWY